MAHDAHQGSDRQPETCTKTDEQRIRQHVLRVIGDRRLRRCHNSGDESHTSPDGCADQGIVRHSWTGFSNLGSSGVTAHISLYNGARRRAERARRVVLSQCGLWQHEPANHDKRRPHRRSLH